MPKRIVVLATSPQKSRVLVVGEKKYHCLNTEEDWQIGKKRKAPRMCAQNLLHDALMAIPSKKHLRECNMQRIILPSGSHCYVTSDPFLSDCVEACRRVRKFMRMSDTVHFHKAEKMRGSHAFEMYTPSTIEAVQCILGTDMT
jgi:hypothetical protein